MRSLEDLLDATEKIEFTRSQQCLEILDNHLQDIISQVQKLWNRPSGELLELKGCSWVIHERYHMDTEDQMKWTFNHCKYRIIKSTKQLLVSRVKNAQVKARSGHGVSVENTGK